jgi:hypothetical protein
MPNRRLPETAAAAKPKKAPASMSPSKRY